MKRNEVLQKLGFEVPACKTKRVIIVSDVKNEADDHFAIIHHLLTPSHDVKGIVACHFEFYARLIEQLKKNGTFEESVKGIRGLGGLLENKKLTKRDESTQRSFDEGELILKLAEMDDIPLFKGSQYELTNCDML